MYVSAANQALLKIDAALLSGDRAALLAALQSSALGLKNVNPDNIDFYVSKLKQLREAKLQVSYDKKHCKDN